MNAFDTYLLRLPSGAGGHGRAVYPPSRLAELHSYDGWLLGCRAGGLHHGRWQIGSRIGSAPKC